MEKSGEGGRLGSLFFDASNDLGIKSRGPDSIYNKGRDIEKVWVKNSPQYLDFTLIHRHVFNEPGRLSLFITLDVDTLENSGRLTLPKDTLTKVPKQAAWEYCVYAGDNDYGIYKPDGSKISRPFGMLVVKTPGPSGIIKVKISKSLINNPQAIRYTIATFAPSQPPNLDTLFQGGSSAVDVFPGTKETFGGEINGYGEVTPLGSKGIKDYTIYYLYNGINPIAEYAPNGSVLARYIYAGGRHIAKVAGADTHWYHCDALGSPRKMTNERGSTVWSATYYPFGEMTAGSNNTHGFTGKEFDSEMGLNYFCQRYYDPEIGRFMTLDPFAGYIELPQSQNRYAYCIGNPLKYIDPLGLVIQVMIKDPDYGAMVDPGVVCTALRWNSPLNPRWMSYLESILSLGSDVDGGGYEGIWPHGGKGGGRKRYGSKKSGGGEDHHSLKERLNAHLDALKAMAVAPVVILDPTGFTTWGPEALGRDTDADALTGIALAGATDVLFGYTGIIIVGGALAGGVPGVLCSSLAWIPTASCTGFMYYKTYQWFLKHPLNGP